MCDGVREGAHLVAAGPGGDVQHGAVLGDVDVVAVEHGVDLLAQLGDLGQLQQQLHARGRGRPRTAQRRLDALPLLALAALTCIVLAVTRCLEKSM